MSKMKLERKYIGEINILDGRVDVTDPCYDASVWCRTTLDVVPGKYNCYGYFGEASGWGRRCWINQIVIAEGRLADIAEERIRDGKYWEEVADIGVDAGLAGYFNHKPDFNDDEWDVLCHMMSEQRHNGNRDDAFIQYFRTGDGFWTESGCGDGGYPVYAIKENGKIIALEIRF